MLAIFKLVVLASLASFAHGVAFRSSIHALIARQDTLSPSDVPSACRTDCAPFIRTLNECSAADCMCGTIPRRRLDTCFDCLTDLAPSTRAQSEETKQLILEDCPDSTVTRSSRTSTTTRFSPTLTSFSPATTANENGLEPDSSNSFPGENNAIIALSLHPCLMIIIGTLAVGGIFGL